MKKPICFLTCLLFFTCREAGKQTAQGDVEFDQFKQRFVEDLWRLYPNWASSVGYHRYDSLLTIPDEIQHQKELLFFSAYADSLNRFAPESLSGNNGTDLAIIRDFLAGSTWGLTTFKSYVWIPSQYNVCEGFAEMLNNPYDSLDTRLLSFYARLQHVAAYYEAAKQNIHQPTLEHTELAISQNSGGISVFEEDLEAALLKSHLNDVQKTNLRSRAKLAVAAIKNYVSWLQQLDHKNARSFRLGKQLYAQKFEHDIQSRHSADEIFERAMRHKSQLHHKMASLTRELWPRYFKTAQPIDSLVAIRRLIDTLSLNHVKPDQFQKAIEDQIPKLVDFINKKDLIYLDPSKPLVVRREPAYMAGFAGASISAPGPYDKNGNTYYNVGSLEGWTAERAESYLREYNHYILQILNIHEAIPGHYTQLVYSNQSPSIIKAILGNGAMVEGWAVYTELMMLENGYGAPDGSPETLPEMWLMYYKWNLRSTSNTILDYSIHVKNLQKEDALKLLINEAFQQHAEAEGKWRRATLSQVQLCSYFTGFTEICDLRDELKRTQGEQFKLKQFHEKFLSYGSAPVKYIRELMLEDLK